MSDTRLPLREIPWHVDCWREDDGTWTAEVWADSYGFGRSEGRKSWHKAVDTALNRATAEAAREALGA